MTNVSVERIAEIRKTLERLSYSDLDEVPLDDLTMIKDMYTESDLYSDSVLAHFPDVNALAAFASSMSSMTNFEIINEIEAVYIMACAQFSKKTAEDIIKSNGEDLPERLVNKNYEDVKIAGMVIGTMTKTTGPFNPIPGMINFPIFTTINDWTSSAQMFNIIESRDFKVASYDFFNSATASPMYILKAEKVYIYFTFVFMIRRYNSDKTKFTLTIANLREGSLLSLSTDSDSEGEMNDAAG
jgi:hypothetical protein